MTDKIRLANARCDVLRMLDAANRYVAGDTSVRRWLGEHPVEGDCAVVAIGKAGAAMLAGARAVLAAKILDALLISAPDYADRVPPGVRFVAGSHPVPDGGSLAAGQALIDFLDGQPAGRHLLFLVSGGASSMVEVLREGVRAEDLARVNRWLLGSGLAISQMNAVRKALSRIKGGGLIAWIGDRPVTALMISDVPGDDPAVIGSGLLVPDDRVEAVLAGLDLPAWLRPLLGPPNKRVSGGLPKPVLVATNGDARQAAASEAGRLGYRAFVHDDLLEGDAAETGRSLAEALERAPPGVHVWGGETTVRLPDDPGRGGRNQHLALAAATVFAGKKGRLLLSAGTDGRDGPGEDAGGLVDGETIDRGSLAGLDVEMSLSSAASGEFLEAAGDLINTGPTGTNVMDLVIGWKDAAD